MLKRVAILGSTGSIGTQALDVIARHPDRFTVVALAAGRRVDELRDQAKAFGASVVSSAADGPSGLMRVALDSKPDILLAATDGFVSFDAVFAAVEHGIDVAVANKELIVAAGELLMESAKRSGSRIVPVDSEHSAIFQCLVGEDVRAVASIVLTASGGPFRRASAEEMANATLEQALAHPTWRMGMKNTVDSATMMNKGLEVIEASRLFGLPGERVQILVHPQSIAHGMVVFTDGSVKMQAAAPDMRLPIGYALAYPDRLSSIGAGESSTGSDCERDPLTAIGGHPRDAALRYDFERPDPVRFPCLTLAYRALAAGGTATATLSAANEVAVEAFAAGRIAFGRIAQIVGEVLENVQTMPVSLENVRRADKEARERASALAGARRRRVEA